MEAFPRDLARLGFGLMRLPRRDGAIDLPQTCEMVDRFLAAGGNPAVVEPYIQKSAE